jgi:phytoene dehydrogenase-like protein
MVSSIIKDMESADVVIVGAGLAGLYCARRLLESHVSVLLVEASDEVGGRVRTDRVGGFLLDRGFQVLLTAYPEARRMLDYGALDLRAFEPGALVHLGKRFCRVSDPWRRPSRAVEALLSEIGTLPDKLRVAWLRSGVCRGSVDDAFVGPEGSTLDFLRARGFSPNIIERFFRPFLGAFSWNGNFEPRAACSVSSFGCSRAEILQYPPSECNKSPFSWQASYHPATFVRERK